MPTREPLFIVGMYKSGTSWLLRILDQHPSLHGVKEIDLISAGAERYKWRYINKSRYL